MENLFLLSSLLAMTLGCSLIGKKSENKEQTAPSPPPIAPQTEIKNTLNEQQFMAKASQAKETFKPRLNFTQRGGLNLAESTNAGMGEDEKQMMEYFANELEGLMSINTEDPCKLSGNMKEAYESGLKKFDEDIQAMKERKIDDANLSAVAVEGTALALTATHDFDGTKVEHMMTGAGNDTQLRVSHTLKIAGPQGQSQDEQIIFTAELPTKTMHFRRNLQGATKNMKASLDAKITLVATDLVKFEVQANGKMDNDSFEAGFSVQETKKNVLKAKGTFKDQKGGKHTFEETVDLSHACK